MIFQDCKAKIQELWLVSKLGEIVQKGAEINLCAKQGEKRDFPIKHPRRILRGEENDEIPNSKHEKKYMSQGKRFSLTG